MPQVRLRVVMGPLAGRLLWFSPEHAEREITAGRAIRIEQAGIQTERLTDQEKADLLIEDEPEPESEPEPPKKSKRKGRKKS